MLTDQHMLSLAVRFVHVAAMAMLVGGSAMLWRLLATTARPQSGLSNGQTTEIAVSYEWLFWLAIGVLVMTGVGNLGAFGSALAGPQTNWGAKLTLKLILVAVLVVGSLFRTVLIVRLRADGFAPPSARGQAILHTSYAATTLLSAAVALVAVVLAHG